jgi:hypothetical protein
MRSLFTLGRFVKTFLEIDTVVAHQKYNQVTTIQGITAVASYHSGVSVAQSSLYLLAVFLGEGK